MYVYKIHKNYRDFHILEKELLEFEWDVGLYPCEGNKNELCAYNPTPILPGTCNVSIIIFIIRKHD